VRPNPRLILNRDLRPSNFNLSQDSQSYLYASQVFEARGNEADVWQSQIRSSNAIRLR